MKKVGTIFREMFSEEKGGKISSKKVWGAIVLTLVSMTYVMDGYHFYEINVALFNSMLLAGVSLIGLHTVGNMFKKSTPKAEE